MQRDEWLDNGEGRYDSLLALRTFQNGKFSEEAVWFMQKMFLGPRSDMEEIAEAIRKIQAHAPRTGAGLRPTDRESKRRVSVEALYGRV